MTKPFFTPHWYACKVGSIYNSYLFGLHIPFRKSASLMLAMYMLHRRNPPPSEHNQWGIIEHSLFGSEWGVGGSLLWGSTCLQHDGCVGSHVAILYYAATNENAVRKVMLNRFVLSSCDHVGARVLFMESKDSMRLQGTLGLKLFSTAARKNWRSKGRRPGLHTPETGSKMGKCF